MITGKTPSGFEYEIDDNVLDDYELIEALAGVEENPLLITTIVNLLFGNCKNKAVEFVKNKCGYASQKEIFNLVTETFTSIKNGKNS